MSALNRTFTKDDVESTETLNRTFTKEDEADRTKTMVLSKNKSRPGLPDAMTANTIGTMEHDENNPNQQQSLKNLRERHHVRRSTVTVNENPLASEVAQLLNEVTASNPEDIMVAIQRKMTHYFTDKEKQYKEDAAKNQRKAAAVLEIKLAKAQAAAASSSSSTSIRTPLSGPGRSISPDQSIEQIAQERDQYRDQAMMHVKTLGELIKQHEVFMDKEKFYQESVTRFHDEQQVAANTITALHERFRALQTEAEQRIKEANQEIEALHKQHDDDTVSLRFKHRQQDLKIKSLESQIETLKVERKELLDMCDDLVARSERVNENKNAAGAAEY
uniref:Transforming acidic coiled-coil-containing protein C-terminal domain-containing protein n=1 Tax=Panagrolaimus sp. ES5 TaxID=591445 RepID=A0AC34FJR2_9BILA